MERGEGEGDLGTALAGHEGGKEGRLRNGEKGERNGEGQNLGWWRDM